MDPIIVDNGSTYEPLLSFLEETPYPTHRLSTNEGKFVVWKKDLIPPTTRWYAVSDPDLDLKETPNDLFEVLARGMEKYHWALKCGPSLALNAIPKHSYREEIVFWEKRHWQGPLDDSYSWSAVDTTLALYHSAIPFDPQRWINPSLRTNQPYTVQHLPWIQLPEKVSEEDYNYAQPLPDDLNVSCWAKMARNFYKGKI